MVRRVGDAPVEPDVRLGGTGGSHGDHVSGPEQVWATEGEQHGHCEREERHPGDAAVSRRADQDWKDQGEKQAGSGRGNGPGAPQRIVEVRAMAMLRPTARNLA